MLDFEIEQRMIIPELTKQSVKTETPRVVVRLKTSFWWDDRGFHNKREAIFLRKKCKGYNFFQDDCANVGADEVFKHIINWYDVPDGVYEVTIVNEYVDWETNILEDYDYKLVPYEGG